MPTFVSGRFVCMFDPQAGYIPNVNPANPGKRIDFLDKAHREVLQAYPDQFKPLNGVFGCDVLAPTPAAFPATLFRFPLRTPAQAEASRLSKQVGRHGMHCGWGSRSCLLDAIYTPNVLNTHTHTPLYPHFPKRTQAHPVPAMRAQLEAFAKEAAGLLLFLKSVERLSVWLWPSGSDGPVKVAEASISNITEELRRQRNFVARTMAASGGTKGGGPPPAFAQQPVGCDYTLETAASVLPPFAPAGVEQSRKETWVVCNRLGGGQAGAIAAAREYQHMKLIPWAGVAGRVAATVSNGGGGSKEVEGLAYCFLPLPVPTQLPVHVNGFFELSSNRRDIWQVYTRA